MSDTTDITKMKVADLKRELKMRGLSTTGNKNELQERLQAVFIEGDTGLEDTTISEDFLEDDVLGDDELDEDTKSLGLLDVAAEEAALVSPPKEDTKAEQSDDIAYKKVILKRNFSQTSSASQSTPAEATDKEVSSSKSEPGKKVVKLSILSEKERLELRAKKFGANSAPTPATTESVGSAATAVTSTPDAVDTKKQARAARFGVESAPADSTGSSSAASIKAGATPASLELLKKRAERFGASVSTTMVRMENAEKLSKRQERFGAGGAAAKTISVGDTATATATATTAATAAAPATEYSEKARLRLERFKTAVK